MFGINTKTMPSLNLNNLSSFNTMQNKGNINSTLSNLMSQMTGKQAGNTPMGYSQNQGYPQVQDAMGFPQQSQGFPQQSQGYPQSQQGYPQTQDTMGFPQQFQGYPQVQDSMGFPQQSQGYPQAQQGFPQAQDQMGFPQQSQGYPQGQGFPQAQDPMGFPQQSQDYSQGQQPNYQQPNYQQPKVRPQGTGVSLVKGQKTSLSKMCPGLDVVEIGLGWDAPTTGQIPYDLDASAFLVGSNNKVLQDEGFVFYGNTTSPDGSVLHLCDSSDGQGDGDDEVIQVQLSRVSPQVAKIAFVVSINEALQRGHNFGSVSNAYIRVVDRRNRKELVRFNLTDYFKEATALNVGELYLRNGEWRFNPVGEGLKTDLAGLCNFFGVTLE